MAKQTFTTGQVLTAAQMTSLQQTAMLGGAASAKTASYTLVAADAGTAISMSNAGATTITVNTGLFEAGDTVHITNLGAGVCTITAGTATVNSSASLALAQYESGFLDFTTTSASIFVKGAGAAAASGSMTLLSTTTLSGTSTTVTVAANSYKRLIAEVQGIDAAANHNPFVQINSITSSVYAEGAFGVIAGGYTPAGADRNGIYFNYPGSQGYGTGNDNLAIVTFFNPNATTIQNATMQSVFYFEPDAYYVNKFANYAIGATAVISSLVFKSDQSLTAGTVKLYGVN
jgi:hypothetical protein